MPIAKYVCVYIHMYIGEEFSRIQNPLEYVRDTCIHLHADLYVHACVHAADLYIHLDAYPIVREHIL